MTVPNPHNFQTVEEEFLAVMTSTVRCTKASARNAYGKRTGGGTAVLVPAYLEPTHEAFNEDSGEVNVANGRAFLGFVIPWLTVDDTFEVQDLEGNWSTVSMIAVEANYGPEGVHHQEVWYGGRGSVRGRA